jgi:hypothetical protein
MKTSFCWILVAVVFAAGCSFLKSDSPEVDAGGALTGAGVGVACKKSPDCRSGLSCVAGACAPAGVAIQGAACILSAECTPGFFCSQEGTCVAAGLNPLGSVCAKEGDCASGLTCVMDGLSGKDFGQTCLKPAECLGGLICASGQCTKASLLPGFAGASCGTQSELYSKVYFRVPRAGDPPTDTDFYRMPFPNDIRRLAGKISLKGHPRPGARTFPFDLVDRYIQAIEAEPMGFGANQTVYFRLTHDANLASLNTPGAVMLLDITPTSPTYGQSVGFQWEATMSRTTYLCDRYIEVRPLPGYPLKPGITYAAIIGTVVTDLIGANFAPDDDFIAMLAGTPPTDPDLAVAYQAYAPLRAFIAAGKADAAGIAAAAVFTVDAYEAPLAAIAKAVSTAAAATVGGLVHCGTPAAVSPCDDGQTGAAHLRGCPQTVSPLFDEYQGTLALPVFQQGTPPYLSPADGGGIPIVGGLAQIVRTEPVCFSLTVPKGVPPTGGFPLVVYAHGTGGSYRSFIELGLAGDYATGTITLAVPASADAGVIPPSTMPMAMLSYDGVMHGTRKGGSTKGEGELVYNFLNPVAARDNALQAAADLLAIPSALPALVAAGVPLNPAQLAVYGHSQGGNAASLAVVEASPYQAFGVSGTGGMLLYTLTGKTSPVNIPGFLPYALGEVSAKFVGVDHPVLNLMQMYFERSDSVNFARRIASTPKPDATARHVLQVVGMGDTYSVVPTQMYYAVAGNFSVAAPSLPALAPYQLWEETPPLRNNGFFGSYGNLTVGQTQYTPAAGKEGHFVSTEVPAARRSIQDFLGTAMRDGVPTIVP